VGCYRIHKNDRSITCHRVSIGIETSRASVIVDKDESHKGPSTSKMLGFLDGVEGIVRLGPHDCTPTDEEEFLGLFEEVIGERKS
jgi:hypothetical protein